MVEEPLVLFVIESWLVLPLVSILNILLHQSRGCQARHGVEEFHPRGVEGKLFTILAEISTALPA